MCKVHLKKCTLNRNDHLNIVDYHQVQRLAHNKCSLFLFRELEVFHMVIQGLPPTHPRSLHTIKTRALSPAASFAPCFIVPSI